MLGMSLQPLLLLGLTGCRKQNGAVQYSFSAKAVEVYEEYLVLEVFDTGNSSLIKNRKVEVSTDVTVKAGCPEFMMGENARVIMARNTDENSSERLEALAIYEIDDAGNILND